METLSSTAPSTAPAAPARPVPPAAPSVFPLPCSACAGALSVGWREVHAGSEIVLRGERIEILVPLDGAALRVPFTDPSGRPRDATLAEPDVALLSPQGRHALCAERPGALLVVGLEPARWAERARAAFGHRREIRGCHVGSDGFVRELGAFLRLGLRGAGAPATEWLDSVGEDLGMHVATRYGRPTQAAGRSGLASHRLQRVLAIVDERLAEPIRVRELADAVHMSPFHFARMFKQSTGHPPHLYITWQRMDRAKQLLAQSSLPLAEVARRVGYQTQAHFTGVFHARVGMTPRAYRMRCRSAQCAGAGEAQPGASEARADQARRGQRDHRSESSGAR